jgi:hypothetical protein
MKGYKVFLFGKLILLSSSFFDRKSIEERNIRIKCLEMACNLIVERNKIEEKKLFDFKDVRHVAREFYKCVKYDNYGFTKENPDKCE